MEFNEYYLNIPLLKTMEEFERDIYINMYHDMLKVYSSINDDKNPDYYEPLLLKHDFDNMTIEKLNNDELPYNLNKINVFLHYYKNLIANKVIIDKREFNIDKIIGE